MDYEIARRDFVPLLLDTLRSWNDIDRQYDAGEYTTSGIAPIQKRMYACVLMIRFQSSIIVGY